jgi:hypothetical protein
MTRPRDPQQLSLWDEATVIPPHAETVRPPTKGRYIFALVTRDTQEIQLPVYEHRQAAREALAWRPDADNLRIERCRILPCRRRKDK